MSEVTEYLDQKGITYTPEGNEVVIVCPQCRKEKLYINKQSLLYQCFVCKAEQPESLYAKGHISQLKNEWGDIMDITPNVSLPTKNKEEKDFTSIVERCKHNLLNGKNVGLKYLAKRGFDESDVERFNLGYREFENEKWIVIPAYEDGIPKLIKYRKITNNTDAKKYRREFNSKSVIYNGDILKDNDNVIITAGEFDAMTLIKHGYNNTVASTGGEGTLSPYMYDKLYLKEQFLLILDADSAGQKAARDVWAKRLGVGRCWNVPLPDGEDINSFFLKYGEEEFNELLEKKHRFKIKGVTSLEEALYEMYKRSLDGDQVYPLPWTSLNKRINGGIKRKQLIVIGAQAGIGKTSMGLQIVDYFATEYNVPSLTVCLEMDEVDLATKIVQVHNDLDYNEIDPSHALVYARDLEELPIYFGYSPTVSADIYYNTVKEARNRYGCELFLFDNLQLMVVSDKESDYASAVKMFKRIAMELDVMMILISQPRKLNREGNMTYDALKGSAAISQGADTVILLNRKRVEDERGQSSFESKTTVITDKARFATGGWSILEMVGRKSRFDEWK